MEQTVQSSAEQPDSSPKEYLASDLLRGPTTTVHKLTYPRRVCALDTETLDVKPSAAVIEVALVSCVFGIETDEQGKMRLVRSSPVEMVFTFNVVDQIARGRSLDPSTYLFHQQKLGHPDFMGLLSAGLALDDNSTRLSLRQIQRHLEGVSELWINGLSFDPGILTSLAATYGYVSGKKTGALWDFQIERDTRTVYRTFPLHADKTQVVHRALPDANWCLNEAWAYHQGCFMFGNFLLAKQEELARSLPQEVPPVAEASATTDASPDAGGDSPGDDEPIAPTD